MFSHRGCTEPQAEVSGGHGASPLPQETHNIFPHVLRQLMLCPRLSRVPRHHQAAAARCLHLQHPLLGITSAPALLLAGGQRVASRVCRAPPGPQPTSRAPRQPQRGSRRRGDQAAHPFPLLAVRHPSSGRMTLPLPKLAAFFLLLSPLPSSFWLSDELYAKSICSCLP